jgi:hypothetical protein
MDFAQTKLTRMEWESIEVPVSDQEKGILKLIIQGYHNVSIKENDSQSLLGYMKISSTMEIEQYLYTKYFSPEIEAIVKNLSGFHPKLPNIKKFKPPKKIDMMRLQNMDENLKTQEFQSQKENIFEFVLLDFSRKLSKSESSISSVALYLYTLLHMQNATIPFMNPYVVSFVHSLTEYIQKRHSTKLIQETFSNAYTIIEKNTHLLRFEDKCLYDHQKQLFQVFRPVGGGDDDFVVSEPRKLVLYTAPTGTGKTMSPLGISEGYRIIYICAARHIGLALARCAISAHKRVAFAFGCETADDIRLHYFSATDFTKNKRTGGIFKVDHSNGVKVEIMICDIYSYTVAMHYMLAFHSEENMIMYWDEPTIGLDVASHPLHPIIQRIWSENRIGNIVLSCATLPEESELEECISDYRQRFAGTIHCVTSSDCKKTISILNPEGKTMLPHQLFESWGDLQNCSDNLQRNLSLLRYLDLREIIRMVNHVNLIPGGLPDSYLVSNYFDNVLDITMNKIKLYYLDVLCNMCPEKYPSIYEYLNSTTSGSAIAKVHSLTDTTLIPKPNTNTGGGLSRMYSVMSTVPPTPPPTISRFKGILLTTEDAHTLTDGPTIYIAENVQKMCQFYVHQSKIPDQVLQKIMEKVEANNVIAKKIDTLTKNIEDAMGTEVEKEKKVEKEAFKPEVKRMMAGIEELRAQIKMVSLSAEYIPNTKQHQQLWIRDLDKVVPNAYTPIVDETSVRKIIELDIENSFKILLLMGVGIFDTGLLTNKTPAVVSYLEVMKQLAYKQRLFLILASSDYIYGTNYQLCHGFLGKDLEGMTQQKIIQAMGRIGRSNIQQEYTVRFRDESLLKKLFLPVEGQNLEAVNMNRLLRTL